MKTQLLKSDSAAVYREVNGELVLIHTDTGRFFYFNRATKELLDFFQSRHSLDEFVERCDLDTNQSSEKSEKQYLQDFCQFLLEKQILQKVDGASTSENTNSSLKYSRPEFLRLGERTLDEVAEEVAVLTNVITF